MMEIKRFKIKDSMKRGKINIVRYYIEDYKNKDNNGFKVLRDIENFSNRKSLGMKDLDILRDYVLWTTIEFKGGKYVSTDLTECGNKLDFDIQQNYSKKGKLRKIVGFSISFME